MRKMASGFSWWLLWALTLPGLSSFAATTTTNSPSSSGASKILCPDAEIWGAKLITGICWSCIFPVRLMTADIGGSGGDVPDDAADKPFCSCEKKQGLPSFGITAGFWAPARLVEIVRKPYCSPTLGGISLQDDVHLMGGHKEAATDATQKTFFNYHYWAFPLFELMQLLMQSNCNAGGYASMDLLYMSELDPLWNNDELSFFVNPEAIVFANPLAMAACAVDCAATSVRKPMASLFWCAGCWGNLYPFTGNISAPTSSPRDSSLLTARLIAGLHRRGLAWKTSGNEALCSGKLYPMLPKQQYRLSTLFPMAEASNATPSSVPGSGIESYDKCCHYIGESTFKWGEWRTIPGTGEDYVYLLWKYTDCCLL